MFFQNSMTAMDAANQSAPARLRVLSWCAVSSEKQSADDKESLPEQRAQNEAFVAHFGQHYPGREAQLVGTIEVVGSRSIRSLAKAIEVYPEYKELERLLEGRQVDAVVLRETSRLGRKAALVGDIEELARENGAVIIPRHGARPDLDGNEDGHALISAIQSTMAQQEIATLMRRKEMGFKGRIKTKRLFASQAPYGYRNVRDDGGKVVRIEVVPEQAAVVRRIFIDYYLGQGLGEPAIAAELNRLGVPTPSQEKSRAGKEVVPAEDWTVSSVHQLLTRVEAYAGYVYWNRKSGEPYIADGGHRKTPKRKPVIFEKGLHEAILTEAEAEAVLAERASRTFSRRTRLWSGSAVCEACNAPMAGTTLRTTRGGVPVKDDGMMCLQCGQSIKDAVIKEAVLAAVELLQEAPDAELEAEIEAQPEDAFAEVDALTKRLADLDAQRQRLLDGWQRGRITDDEYDERTGAVAKERAKAVQALDKAKAKQAERHEEGRRGERIAEVRAAARDLLARAETEPDLVGQWLRKHVRAYVRPSREAGRGAKRVRVEFI